MASAVWLGVGSAGLHVMGEEEAFRLNGRYDLRNRTGNAFRVVHLIEVNEFARDKPVGK